MRIRQIQVEDLGQINRIREQVETNLGFELDLPSLTVQINGKEKINPRFETALVYLDDSNTPRMATLLKKTTEAYLLMDKNSGVGYTELLNRFSLLQKATHQQALSQGVFDTFTFLSPELASTWSRVLESPEFGWKKEAWAVWRKIHGE